MEVLRKQNERMSKQVADVTAENKKLVEPLKQALSDVAEYKRQLEHYEKDKLSLAVIDFPKSPHRVLVLISEHQSQTECHQARTGRPAVGQRRAPVAFREGKTVDSNRFRLIAVAARSREGRTESQIRQRDAGSAAKDRPEEHSLAKAHTNVGRRGGVQRRDHRGVACDVGGRRATDQPEIGSKR
jgi:hypothetical protein